MGTRPADRARDQRGHVCRRNDRRCLRSVRVADGRRDRLPRDAANYLISLFVAGLALRWRARAALLKGVTLLVVGLWLLSSTLWMAYAGSVPQAETMGVIGILALAANLWCALLLWRHREGDANRRSVWICSRNDAIGNGAVVAAAGGVFGTGSAWPDIGVAIILAGLGISGGWQIIRHAMRELKMPPVMAAAEQGRALCRRSTLAGQPLAATPTGRFDPTPCQGPCPFTLRVGKGATISRRARLIGPEILRLGHRKTGTDQ